MTTLEAALRLVVFSDAESEPYAVGGALRDALLGIDVSEVDIVVRGAEQWVASAADCLGVRAAGIGKGPVTWRLAVEGGWIDVTDFDGDLIADLRRRDFTVNAMAAPLDEFLAGDVERCVIDPLDGRGDLAAGRLRLAAPQALAEDPLRVLRGVRFEATHSLQMTAETEAEARRRAADLSTIAAERVWAELERMLSHDRTSPSVRRMDSLGALDVVFPDLALGRGVDQRPIHRRDVFNHQLDALEWLDILIAPEPPNQTPGEPPDSPIAARLWRELWESDALADAETLRAALWESRATLRLATLLHDIGKPATRTVEPDGRTRFFGHSELGAELVESRLTALRAPSAALTDARALILHHLRPGQIAAPGQAPSDRALYRFHKALGDLALPLCWLFLADSLATAGGAALAPRWPAYVAHVARILGWRERRPTGGAERILNGHAIMEATGLTPGPRIGEIGAAIDEAAALGEIETVEQARTLAVQLAAAAPGAEGSAGRD